MAVHPSAIVEDGAKLGAGVEIGPFCMVGKDVVLGDGVRLVSHAVVTGRSEIGARTVIHPQAVIGGEGQIRKNDFDGQLVVGSDCVMRESVTMNAGSKSGRGITRVGNNGYFMAYSHISHDCIVDDDVTFANCAALGGHVTVGQGVVIGGLTPVQQFCRIGRGAMLGGASGINTDVIPYGMAFGDHAVLGGLNLIGLKRRGVSRENINALRHAFKAIFLATGGSLFDRTRAAREKWAGIAEVQEVVDFILDPSAKQSLCVADPARVGTAED